MLSIVQAAGWPIWPLLLCSVLALALIVERAWSLRSAQVVPEALLNDLDRFDAKQLPGIEVADRLAQTSLLGQLLSAGLRAVIEDPTIPDTRLRQVMEMTGRRVVHALERFLTALGTIATAAPLLGLLGTVVGMIEIFGSQSPTGTNPQILAHGISVALYNTGFGILIAVPALIFYRHFRGRVEHFVVEMEQASIKLLDIAHGDRKA